MFKLLVRYFPPPTPLSSSTTNLLHQGVGDLTKVNIPAGDAGGELDPHGADGNGMTHYQVCSKSRVSLIRQPGNPIGGLVFSSAFTGQIEQLHEWTVRKRDKFTHFNY